VKTRSIVVIVLLVVALIAGWFIWRGGFGTGTIDLIAEFPDAEKRPTDAVATTFSLVDTTIDGKPMRAILAKTPSRIIWRLRVPEKAWLGTSLGIQPEAWDKEGDGVLFRIGVSFQQYDELLNRHLNPIKNESDRRWIPVNLDLSAYANQDVEIIFNTNASLPKQGDDRRNDLAVWGAPEIYVRE
jgi:hypothetical protein